MVLEKYYWWASLATGVRHKSNNLAWVSGEFMSLRFELNGFKNMLFKFIIAAAITQDIA